MNKLYILNRIYNSENCANLANSKECTFYPIVASKELSIIEKRLEMITNSYAEVEEIDSLDIHMGSYFRRVVRGKCGSRIVIYGISETIEE